MAAYAATPSHEKTYPSAAPPGTSHIDTYTLLCVVTNLRSPSAFQYRGAGILSCSVPAMWIFVFNDPIFVILHTAFQRLRMLSTIVKGARLLIRRFAFRSFDPQRLANLLYRPLMPFDFQHSTLYVQKRVRFREEMKSTIMSQGRIRYQCCYML